MGLFSPPDHPALTPQAFVAPTLSGTITLGVLLSDLRTADTSRGVFLVGKYATGDGLGGHYYWDPNNSQAEDLTYMNVITSNNSATGRWVRVFQRAQTYPQGVMVLNGGVKTLYMPNLTVDANSQVTVYLTDDGTATGNALFTEYWAGQATASVSATTPTDAVFGCQKSISADLKTLVFYFVKGQTTTLGGTLTAILGTVIPGLAKATMGTATAITVVGR